MKKVISTKVDGTKYTEFLEYCAKENKYPANALRDALDLLLKSDKNEDRPELKGEAPKKPTEDAREKQNAEVDEDEAELEW